MTDDRTQNDLALERTHAAWIRTCLTFLVAAIAARHYSNNSSEWAVAIVLAVGGALAAVRGAVIAPDMASRLSAYALVVVSLGALVINI